MCLEQYTKKIATDVESTQEFWEEFLNSAAGCEFESFSDVLLFGIAACQFENCIDELTEITEITRDAELTELTAETAISTAIFAVSLLRYMSNTLEGESVSGKDLEWVRWLANEAQKTLFNMIRSSQELIMGE
nr:MAG TPA: hypothetical protein [Caudoviricetes sp.]